MAVLLGCAGSAVAGHGPAGVPGSGPAAEQRERHAGIFAELQGLVACLVFGMHGKVGSKIELGQIACHSRHKLLFQKHWEEEILMNVNTYPCELEI